SLPQPKAALRVHYSRGHYLRFLNAKLNMTGHTAAADRFQRLGGTEHVSGLTPAGGFAGVNSMGSTGREPELLAQLLQNRKTACTVTIALQQLEPAYRAILL